LATITDRKNAVSSAGNSSLIDHFDADIASAQDYYPFGMQMPGRTYSSGSYRYGFNGKEQDPEVKGSGAQYDYGFRIYDPRIGKFLSIDPLFKEYAQLTPYQFASNTPIFAIDRDGKEFEPYWASTKTHDILDYERELYKKDPQHAAQIIFHNKVNAFLFVGGALTAGFGASLFATAGTTATLTNITAGAVTSYATYSVAAANVGAFVIELLNPDPNGTPGLEFAQGDEVARGLKLLFKQNAAPLILPLEKFIVNTTKLDYLFGKLEYQNLKGIELDVYAKNVGRTVESLIHNQDRAASMAKVFEYWGIKDNNEGFSRLTELFNMGLNGKVISSKINEFGTTITKELSLVFTAGKKKGQDAGSIQISYFYQGSNMNLTPEISSVIPKSATTP
ncbi:RHS repeat-associated core domain-containing protein, partial [Flavitalea flava]